jgi:hypothetical protein
VSHKKLVPRLEALATEIRVAIDAHGLADRPK